MHRALQKDPAQRFPSMQSMAAALAEVATAIERLTAVSARRDNSGRVRLMAQRVLDEERRERNRRWLGGAAIVGALVAASIVGLGIVKWRHAPKEGRALLVVTSQPAGARVTVDGEMLRAPTPIHAETFASGMHKVIVEKKGYTPRELAVRLGDGEHRTLDVELRPGARRVVRVQRAPSGYLTVRTVPWSKVFEGARLLGTTPMANVPLAEGTHTLTFVNPDLPPLKRTVTVRAGEEQRVSIELKK